MKTRLQSLLLRSLLFQRLFRRDLTRRTGFGRARTLFFLLSLVLSLSAAGAGQSTPAKAAAKASAAADYSKQAFVQEEAKTTIRFESDGTGQRRQSGRYRVESEAGVQQLGLIRLGYNTGFERLTIEYVRVVKPDGTVIAAPTGAVQDLPSEVQRVAPMYTDFREKHINVPALRPGDRLEYSFRTDIHTATVPGQFWAEYSFEKKAIMLDEQFELDLPADRAVKLKYAPGFTPKVEEKAGRKIYRWSHANLKADEGTPADDEPPAPDIQLSSFRDWAEVSRWYAGLAGPPAAVTPAIRAKAEELTKGLKTEAEKVAAIYFFVSSDIRYLGLSFGTGRFEPHAAGEVLNNAYGDCKDKHTLLAALLAAIGVKSDAVLISTERKLDPEVPAPQQFNHLISLVKSASGEVFVDTTTEVAPWGYLIPALRKKQALLAKSGGGALVTTTAAPPVANMETLSVDGRVDESGKLDAQVTLRAAGDPGILWRTILRRTPEAQWPQVFKITLQNTGIPGAEVSDVSSTDPSDPRKPLQAKMRLTKSNYVDWSKAKAVPLPMVKIGMQGPAGTPEQKKSAIKIGSPTATIRELRLELPPARTVLPPSDSRWKDDFGEFESSYKVQGAELTAHRELRTKLEELPRARYEDYNKMYNAVTTDEGEEATLERGLRRRALVPESGVSTNNEPKRARDLFASGRRAWESGDTATAEHDFLEVTKLDPKYPQAWLALARVYGRKAMLEKQWMEKTLAAYRNELSVDPNDTAAMREFGFLLFQEGRLGEAAEVMKKELQADPASPGVNTMLGLAYLYEGKPTEAIAPLERASNQSSRQRNFLARAYFDTGATDKGMAVLQPALERGNAVEMAEAASVMAEAGVKLERAEQAGNAALKTAYETLHGADYATAESDMRSWKVTLIWDAVGWVYWKKGDAAKARSYLEAAWTWSRQLGQADHLARLEVAEGKTAEALAIWAEALSGFVWQQPDIKAHFVKAAGSKERAEALIEKHRLDGQKNRTYEFANKRKLNGSAEVKLLIGPGPAIVDVSFASGDEKLKAYAPAIKALRLRMKLPDAEEIRLAQEAIVSCTELSPNCMMVLRPGPSGTVAWPGKTKF